MKKSFTDSKTGIRYELKGDYYLPCLAPPEIDGRAIGIWGERRRQYLRDHRKALYYSLLTSGDLQKHLADTNEAANEMFCQLVNQLAKQEGITEQLKVQDQMAWVGAMNNIRNRVTEIINAELIYA